MTNIQIEKAHPQQVGIREVKKKIWKRIFTSHFSLHSQWESRKVKMPEVAASAPLTLDLIRPSRFGLRKTRTLWILPNSTPSDAARKKKTDKCFSHQGCAKYDKIDRTSNMTLALCVTRDTNFCPIQLHQNCFVKILCGVFLFLVISDL